MREGWQSRLVRWAFDRFYNEGAWTYDVVAALISRGHWARWILAVLPQLRGRVLELGCGTGWLQVALAADPAAGHVGLDLSPAMLRLPRRRLRRQRRGGLLVRSRGQQLPFSGASFDTVVATFPADYILHPATLAEARRVLRRQGRLIIVDAGDLPPGLYRHLVELLYQLVFGRSASAPPGAPVVDLRVELLRAAGFQTSALWLRVGASRVQLLIGSAE
jgi:ubiquinone/menaquinone biosynthesis C-methylase UbiE